MMVLYNGLWEVVIDRNILKQNLVNKVGLSSATVAKQDIL